jgi:hypothetical protein
VAELEVHCHAARTAAGGTHFPGFVEFRLIEVRLAMGPVAPGLLAPAQRTKKMEDEQARLTGIVFGRIPSAKGAGRLRTHDRPTKREKFRQQGGMGLDIHRD